MILINKSIQDKELLIGDEDLSDSDLDSEIVERNNLERIKKRT